MASEQDLRRRAYIDKTTAEVDGLIARGVRLGGNAFSAVLLLKAEVLSDVEERALKASLDRLGYAPEDWETLLVVDAAGTALTPDLLREAVCVLDPATVVCLDEGAGDAMREAYADDLALLESLDEALLSFGVVAQVCGMRVLNLSGFGESLASGDAAAKQRMWAALKRLPPLAEPY